MFVGNMPQDCVSSAALFEPFDKGRTRCERFWKTSAWAAGRLSLRKGLGMEIGYGW